jgi:hypothetical protein
MAEVETGSRCIHADDNAIASRSAPTIAIQIVNVILPPHAQRQRREFVSRIELIEAEQFEYY